MDEKKTKVNELVSMNDTLYDEYYVNELEERLETDPLMVGGLLNFLIESGQCDASPRCGIKCTGNAELNIG